MQLANYNEEWNEDAEGAYHSDGGGGGFSQVGLLMQSVESVTKKTT